MDTDQLVLGSGGVLGGTWMSAVIAGMLEGGGPDLRRAARFVGTSAGSIVATRLAAGQDMREYVQGRFGIDPGEFSVNSKGSAASHPAPPVATGRASGALASALLSGTRPAGALLRRTALKLVPEGREELARLGETIERLMPDWDSRLHLVGVESRRGRRVVISAGTSFGLTPAEGVRASCAIPGVFSPVESSRGPIVDGGIWSPVNLDAIRTPVGASILCLYPSGYFSQPRSLKRSAVTRVSRGRVAVEVAAARRGGARVVVVTPDVAAAEAIGPNRMDHRRDPAVARAGYLQGLDLAQNLSRLDQPEVESGRSQM